MTASRMDAEQLSQLVVAALEEGEATVLPETTLEALRRQRVALKGPCTTPIGGGFA